MAKPDLAAIILAKKKPMGEEEEPESPQEEMPEPDSEDAFDHLSEEEIEEHEKSTAEEFIEAIKKGDVEAVIHCFKALHGLDHAIWDKGEAPESKPEMEEDGEEEQPEE